MLVPKAVARVAPEEKVVVVERLRGEDITNLPPYKHEPVTREYELELQDRIGDRFRPPPSRSRASSARKSTSIPTRTGRAREPRSQPRRDKRRGEGRSSPQRCYVGP